MNSIEIQSSRPMEQLPPPNKRIRCFGCGKRRIISINRESPKTWEEMKIRKTLKKLSWHYIGYGHFCTMKCATNYANRIVDNIKERPQDFS